jgi:RNA polymerase sigma-70 factor (ECF subfamily)
MPCGAPATDDMTLTLSSSPDFGRRAPDPVYERKHRPSAQRRDLRRAEDERAFASMFLEHYPSLCEFVDAYVRAPDVAEELVQAVFLRLWETRESWEPKRGARAYLFAACRNQALDFLRHERIVSRTAEQAIEFDIGPTHAPARADADLEAAELTEQLRAVVERLPERRRMVVVLRWQHQLTNPEIARVMGISVKGVEMQFSRALADLRRTLGSRLVNVV